MSPAAFLVRDFTFAAGDFQPVLSGNRSDGSHQRHPSMLGFDFVEAQEQTRMKPVTDRAHVALDSAVAKQSREIRPEQVFRESRLKSLAGLNPGGVELVFEADQKCGSFGDGMWRSWVKWIVPQQVARRLKRSEKKTANAAKSWGRASIYE